ncbi:hypothetical protein ACMD2_18338 [Ananas comosus]|uniref:Uncharacterized protein n=1 Tax=Ananas comosus TaxID=4615 RepID=A0A199VA28_ANACO|nr:hypothetical protein ACMD2_18338 [Ananas comosus]
MPPRSTSDKRIRSSSGQALGSIGSMSRRSKSRECRRMRTSATWHLLDENEQLLIQITSNLELFKIQENMDPFLRTSNNIATILNRYVLPVISSQSVSWQNICAWKCARKGE